VKPLIAALVAVSLNAACSAAPVEKGVFFPTWSPDGAVPAGIVQGTLVEDVGCLYLVTNDRKTLVAWEDGMGFKDGTLLDASGSPVARIGEEIHGGGGYGSRSRLEELSGQTIPKKCGRGERFAIIYDVQAGP
jgi:hypothetical protein